MEETLFVLPPSPAFICPIHGGILQNPVTNSCGHSFCQECIAEADTCPFDGMGLKDYNPNNKLQVDIDSLLCYCKYGVMKGSNGTLVPNPKGCSAIIKYSNRLAHEASCDFNDKDFILIDSNQTPPPSPPVSSSKLPAIKPIELSSSINSNDSAMPNIVLTPCPNKDDGCFFLGETEEEMAIHLAHECTYEKLRNMVRVRDEQIAILQQELIHRDDEIRNLRQQLEAKNNSQPTGDIEDDFAPLRGKEIWEDIVKALEEIPIGLSNARESVIQKSTTTISSIKTKLSKRKQELNDLHPLDRLIAVLSSIKDELITSLKESMIKPQKMITDSRSPTPEGAGPSTTTTTTTTTTTVQTAPNPEEEDPEMKKQIEASLETFEAEKQARLQLEAFEAAAIAAAAAQSLAQVGAAVNSAEDPEEEDSELIRR